MPIACFSSAGTLPTAVGASQKGSGFAEHATRSPECPALPPRDPLAPASLLLRLPASRLRQTPRQFRLIAMNNAIISPTTTPTIVPAARPRASTFCSLVVIATSSSSAPGCCFGDAGTLPTAVGASQKSSGFDEHATRSPERPAAPQPIFAGTILPRFPASPLLTPQRRAPSHPDRLAGSSAGTRPAASSDRPGARCRRR